MLLNNQRLPLILTIIAGAAMLSVTAWQSYSFWYTESYQAISTNDTLTRPALPADAKVPVASLASFDLFGSASNAGNNQEVNTEDLPETNLRLYLRGVMAADGELPGSALIEDSNNKTEAYLIGDELPGNATLRSVYPNRVIIERQGKLENLFFPESEDPAGISFSAERQNATIPAPTQGSSASTPAPTSASGQTQRREEIRKRLEQLRERLRTNN